MIWRFDLPFWGGEVSDVTGSVIELAGIGTNAIRAECKPAHALPRNPEPAGPGAVVTARTSTQGARAGAGVCVRA